MRKFTVYPKSIMATRSNSVMLPKIVDVSPSCGGGGWYLFWGAFSDGTYFMASTPYWDLRVVDSDPRATYNGDYYEAEYPEWQQEHLVQDIDSRKTKKFFDEMLKWVLANKPNDDFCNYNSGDIKEIIKENNSKTGSGLDRNQIY